MHVLFSCGLRADGEVDCWGARRPNACYSEWAECPGWAADPIPPGPFAAFDVASGRSELEGTVCAVRPSGEMVCWGEGQSRLRPPDGEFVGVEVGRDAACGLRSGGETECWGRVDWLGQVPGSVLEAVSVDRMHACGLRSGGEGVVECWGDNTWGAAAPPPGEFTAIDVEGRLSCGLRPGGEAECWGEPLFGDAEPPPGPFTAIQVRDTWRGTYVCALRADGTAACWLSYGPKIGQGDDGEMDTGETVGCVECFEEELEMEPWDPAWG
ncbi:MAG: hypothetical protein OXH20_03895 [bacterium]|nr:hypothetical protein [bacterium]